MAPPLQTYYRGNPNLKAAYIPVSYTPEQILELKKCAADPIYFVRNYIKITNVDYGVVPFDLYKFQEDLIQTYLQERFVIAKFPRQVGKTTTTAAFLIWCLIFKPDFAVAVLAHKMTTAREILGRIQKSYEYLPFWMQQGVKEWTKSKIVLENGAWLQVFATSADAIRGFSWNIVLLDEYAMVPSNIADDFFTSVFPTISSGKTTQVLVLSTPRGMNHFYSLWEDCVHGRRHFVMKSVHWSDVPGRDAKWEAEQRAELKDKFNQEHLCEFLGTSDTLIAAAVLQRMVVETPIWETDEMAVYEAPKKKDPDDDASSTHTYVITVDTSEGVGGDYHAFSVIDITEFPYKQVARYQSNESSYLMLPNMIYDMARKYNDAYVLIETMGVGLAVADCLHYELEYEHILRTVSSGRAGQVISGGHQKKAKNGCKMTKPLRSIGCNTIKELIEGNKLDIWDAETFSELTTFAEHGGRFQAEAGKHDDLVMTLVLFGWLTTQQYFKELTDFSVRRKLYEDNQKQIEESMMPFGVIDNGLNQEVEVDDNGMLWHETSQLQDDFDRLQAWDLNSDSTEEDREEFYARLYAAHSEWKEQKRKAAERAQRQAKTPNS